MALLSGAGKVVRRAGDLAKGVGRSRPGRFIGRHPGLLMGGAVAAGFASANPFQSVNGITAAMGAPTALSALPIPGIGIDPLGTGSEVMGALLGDPNAARDVTRAKVGQAAGYPITPSRSETTPSVDGSLVFGLWNERLR